MPPTQCTAASAMGSPAMNCGVIESPTWYMAKPWNQIPLAPPNAALSVVIGSEPCPLIQIANCM